MAERDFDKLIEAAQSKRLHRRDLLRRAAALGLSAPAIAALLAACGGDDEPAATTGTSGTTGATATSATAGGPTATSRPIGQAASPAASPATTAKRGGGGTLKILWWQAPTILNGHLSVAGKDIGAIHIAMESLAHFNSEGDLVPVLAAEIPSLANGGIARDGTSVTWKIRRGVKWHDGTPMTAKDVAFTFKYLSDPATTATTLGFYRDVATVEALDDYTAKVTFKNPVAAWFNPFTGNGGTILPEHILKDFVGAKAKDAPFNLKPIGTGPFKVVDFRPGDLVVYEINNDYWDPGKPFFDRVEFKGGGDATSAARAVVQSGEYDWAWNLQIDAAVLKSLENAPNGKVVTWPGAGTEKMLLNHSDPLTEKDGQRSHRDVPHPHFKELKIRQAVALSIPRNVIAEQLYGPVGEATGYTMNENPDYMPPGIKWEYNLDKAKALLDEVGARPGAGGIREFNGRPLNWTYSASVNVVRQKTQEVIKDSLAKIGIGIEIRAIDASAYFDAANELSFQHMYYDFGTERNGAGIWPINWYVRYLSADPLKDIAQKENNWSGRNFGRFQNARFNEMYNAVLKETDKAKYTQLYLDMQKLVVDEVADIGLVSSNNVAAASKRLSGYTPSPYSVETWDIANWKKS